MVYFMISYHLCVINMGSRLKIASNLSDLSFRMDSDIEEKRQNAIEQVWKSKPISCYNNEIKFSVAMIYRLILY